MSYTIGIPTNGSFDYHVVDWLTRERIDPIVEKRYSVTTGREKITKRFLEETDDEWLVYLDDDNVPRQSDLFDRLSEISVDVIQIPTLFNHLEWSFLPNGNVDGSPSLTDYELRPPEDQKPVPVKLFGGTGICIRRSVFDRLDPPYWVEPPSEVTSSNFLFVRRLAKIGVQPHVLYGAALHHYKDGFDLLDTYHKVASKEQ